MKIYSEENAKRRKETELRVPRLSPNSNFSSELRSRWKEKSLSMPCAEQYQFGHKHTAPYMWPHSIIRNCLGSA